MLSNIICAIVTQVNLSTSSSQRLVSYAHVGTIQCNHMRIHSGKSYTRVWVKVCLSRILCAMDTQAQTYPQWKRHHSLVIAKLHHLLNRDPFTGKTTELSYPEWKKHH